jgi:uncharacterized protein (DUF2147 family)
MSVARVLPTLSWAFAMLILPALVWAQSAAASPVGLWRTYGDDGARPVGLVRIAERQGELVGTIVRMLEPDADPNETCARCPGEWKDKPIVGLVFLSGLRQAGQEYVGGEILDPDTGQSYRARLRVEAGGRRLVVRGYVGIELFGRSQTWERVE